MKSLFGTQDVIEIMQDGYEELGEDIINAQRTTFKELRKKDYKALFYIQQNVDSHYIEKNLKATRPKEA